MRRRRARPGARPLTAPPTAGLICQAASAEERDEWLSCICAVLVEVTDKHKTAAAVEAAAAARRLRADEAGAGVGSFDADGDSDGE